MKKYIAELIGTMFLVLIGCGAAVSLDIVGNLGVALAFGLAIVAAAYTLGTISGAHLNPAVTFGFLVSKRINIKDGIFYMIFQIIGALIGACILSLIFGRDSGLGINIVQPNVTVLQGMIFELVFTFIFVFVILAVTAKEKFANLAGLVIGLTLTAMLLVGIPVTGASLNPARSIAPALITLDPTALSQLWIFIIMPLVGALAAAIIWEILND